MKTRQRLQSCGWLLLLCVKGTHTPIGDGRRVFPLTSDIAGITCVYRTLEKPSSLTAAAKYQITFTVFKLPYLNCFSLSILTRTHYNLKHMPRISAEIRGWCTFYELLMRLIHVWSFRLLCWIHTKHETEKSLASSEDSVNRTRPKSTSSALNKAAELCPSVFFACRVQLRVGRLDAGTRWFRLQLCT